MGWGKGKISSCSWWNGIGVESHKSTELEGGVSLTLPMEVCTYVISQLEERLSLVQVIRLKFEDVSLEASQQAPDLKTAKKCVAQVQELVFQELSKAISERLISSVNYLRESVVGTLQRCLEKLEDSVQSECEAERMWMERDVCGADGEGCVWCGLGVYVWYGR